MAVCCVELAYLTGPLIVAVRGIYTALPRSSAPAIADSKSERGNRYESLASLMLARLLIHYPHQLEREQHMSIMELGALGEFLGIFALVATLIYLAIQNRTLIFK